MEHVRQLTPVILSPCDKWIKYMKLKLGSRVYVIACKCSSTGLCLRRSERKVVNTRCLATSWVSHFTSGKDGNKSKTGSKEESSIILRAPSQLSLTLKHRYLIFSQPALFKSQVTTIYILLVAVLVSVMFVFPVTAVTQAGRRKSWSDIRDRGNRQS